MRRADIKVPVCWYTRLVHPRFVLTAPNPGAIRNHYIGGINSVGRVLASQAESRRFESGIPL